jgi:hypothetical protein
VLRRVAIAKKATFVLDTPTERLAREVIGVAARATHKAAEWESDFAVLSIRVDELTSELLKTSRLLQESHSIVTAQNVELEQLTPLKDAVLFARSQRRPMGIGQDFAIVGAPCVSIELGTEYGRELDNCVGFWIESDEISHTDADSPSPCHRIALALDPAGVFRRRESEATTMNLIRIPGPLS